MRAPRFDGPAHRFLSWNVAGMRALVKKDVEALKRLVESEQVDALCLQVCWFVLGQFVPVWSHKLFPCVCGTALHVYVHTEPAHHQPSHLLHHPTNNCLTHCAGDQAAGVSC